MVDPIACHAFFEQAEFERLLCNHLLEILCLATQFLHLVSVRRTSRVTSKPLLTGFYEILGPFVIDAL